MFKALSVFMAGCLISFVFLVNLNTFSWFTAQVESNFTVTSATQDDIIESITITQDDSCIRRGIIRVETTDTTNPEIYFEVTGDIYDYIQHINPIKESDYNGSVGETYINLKVSCFQLHELLFGNLNEDVISGTIVVRVLNGYIIDERDIEIPKTRLLRVFVNQIPRRRTRTIATNDGLPISEDEITDIMTYLAEQVMWQTPDGKDQSRSLNMQLSTTPNSNLQMSKMEALGPQPPQVLGIPINRLELSENQQMIMNIVAPSLQLYLDQIYGEMDNLVAQINKNNQKIYELETNKRNLEDINKELEAAILELTSTNEGLNVELEELINTYEKLALQYDELVIERDRVLNDYELLKDENAKLTSTNNDLNSDLDKLRTSNTRLRSQLENLSSQLSDAEQTITSKNELIITQQQEIVRLSEMLETLQQQFNQQKDDSDIDVDGSGDNDVDDSGDNDVDDSGDNDVDDSGDNDVDDSGDNDVDDSGDNDVDGSGDNDVDGSRDNDVDGSGDNDVDGSGDSDGDSSAVGVDTNNLDFVDPKSSDTSQDSDEE